MTNCGRRTDKKRIIAYRSESGRCLGRALPLCDQSAHVGCVVVEISFVRKDQFD
jgi:hypothetical protein